MLYLGRRPRLLIWNHDLNFVPFRKHSISAASSRRLTIPGSRNPNKSAQPGGPASEFDAYFSQQWADRWPPLAASLLKPTTHCASFNPFVPGSESILQSSLSTNPIQPSSNDLEWLTTPLPVKAAAWHHGAAHVSSSSYMPPMRDPTSGLLPWYWLDPASLLPPIALGVSPGHKVLDVCAAPGGKSLILASFLFGTAAEQSPSSDQTLNSTESIRINNENNGLLVCNEIDSKRRMRLLNVLRQYLPDDLLMTHVRVTGRDGATWSSTSSTGGRSPSGRGIDSQSQQDDQEGGEESGARKFDRILIDAPCSSDRHVAQQAAAKGSTETSPTSLAVPKSDWNVQRCKTIAKTQFKLLAAGIKNLAIGGRLVYSTCSIAEIENDEVIRKLLERSCGAVQVVHDDDVAVANALNVTGGIAEKTHYGWLILPDTTNWGPIYFAVLEKCAETDLKRVKENKYAKQR